ncbi:clavesin-2 [Lutzomyia longipalpis]|nr:clavesin-2 [Lutzomyia longipalpis]XP_055682227.1 clavesin-2 [Lutzomyia longipalpis]XP_055682228.1 clavesin-2 [Lutzomyia longipalpis]
MAVPPFTLNLSPLSDSLLELSRVELRETPEIREKSIRELRQLLHEATDLHYRDDDDFLLIFLRPCHFYPESALKMMRRIAEFKKTHNAMLKHVMPEDERSAFEDHNIVNVLTNLDHKGRRVLIVNCGAPWDPKIVNSDKLFRIFYLVHLAAQLELATQIRGVVVIMDFEGLSMKQIKALSPAFSKRLLTFIQEAMPLRLKEVHIIKQPYLFKMVWTFFKPFIQEKLGKRMHFHGNDMKSLHKFMDPDYLPANYGGNLPAINYCGKDWFPCILDHIDHIEKWNSYGYANAIP